MAARRAALAILDGVARGTPFDAARDRAVEGLDQRDRRLAHELAAGVLRHTGELDRALAPLVNRGLDSVPPGLRRILRLGAYQLLRLDRIPPHAAVATSVDLARELAGDRAAGFVNAVLRRIEATAPHASPPAPAATPGDLARRFAHPEWLVARWWARFGPEATARLVAWNNTRPPLVVQPARWTAEELAARLAAGNIAATEAPFGAGFVVTGTRPEALPGYREGGFLVQDPAQALVVRFVSAGPEATVYDACAAPGGKTVALGRVVRRVVAGEARRDRVRRLRENLERAGSGREFVILADAAHPPLRSTGIVLLDAPCLGTGAFARHPDARHRVSPAGLTRLVARQASLLEALAPVVEPGGLLVYSTCSLEPEENERQVTPFLERHPEFHRDPPPDWPADLLTPDGDLWLFPPRHGTDGAYAARLRRTV